MANMLDKNGKPLRGGAKWLRKISLDGGLEKHDKKVAMEAFEKFLDSKPEVARAIAENEAQERRRKIKVVK